MGGVTAIVCENAKGASLNPSCVYIPMEGPSRKVL